jgi:hypothetical protein
LSLADSLRRIAPGFTGLMPDAAVYADVQRQLSGHLSASLATLPRDDFEVSYSLGAALRCALIAAPAAVAAAMHSEMERIAQADPESPFAAALLGALRERPAPQMARTLDSFDRHPSCAVRSEALALRLVLATDEHSRTEVARLAQAAARSPCWRLQAQALAVLKELGVTPQACAAPPSFLGVARD